MQLYAVLRRNGWTSADDLEKAAKRSTEVADKEFPNDIRWIRSYVISEERGGLGTVCVYEASDPDAVRRHAAAVGMPADEVIPVADTVIVRPDPAVS